MIKLLNTKQNTIVSELHDDILNHFTYNSDDISNGINLINDLLDKYDLDIFDVEEDGVNLIESYDMVHDWLAQSLKADPDQPYYLQDLNMIDTDNWFDQLYDYYYINGYARVEHVTVADVLGELDDILDYIKDNHLNK